MYQTRSSIVAGEGYITVAIYNHLDGSFRYAVVGRAGYADLLQPVVNAGVKVIKRNHTIYIRLLAFNQMRAGAVRVQIEIRVLKIIPKAIDLVNVQINQQIVGNRNPGAACLRGKIITVTYSGDLSVLTYRKIHITGVAVCCIWIVCAKLGNHVIARRKALYLHRRRL